MKRKRAVNYRLVLRGSCLWFGPQRGGLTTCDDATPLLERSYLGVRLLRRAS